MSDQNPLILSILAILLLVGLTSATAQEGTTEEVEATDAPAFEPATLEIEVGTTVQWTNTGNNAHTVTSRDDHFNEALPAGGDVSYTFDEPGTYEYYCIPHEGQGMTGTIMVLAADNGAASDPGTGADDGVDPGDDTNDTPGPAFAVVLAVLAGLVYLGRRR